MTKAHMACGQVNFKPPDMDASCQVWFHFALLLQRRCIFFESANQNKTCPWRPYLLTDQDEMNNLYKGPYINASCTVWFHLAALFQRKCIFLINQSETRIYFAVTEEMHFHCYRDAFSVNQPIRNKKCLRRPYLCPLSSLVQFGLAVSTEMHFLLMSQSETRIASGRHIY